MGSGAGYRDGVKQYQTIDVLFGAKLITKVENVKKGKMVVPDNTPAHSYTPNTIYAKRDSKTSKIDQITIYENHDKVRDIDWGHAHEDFAANDVHVHEYHNNIRSKKARAPTKIESELVNNIRREDGQI